MPTAQRARILSAARVGLKSGTVRYHVTVVTVVLFATDVDLLESSSQQSLFRHGFTNCVCSVRDVARLCISSGKHQFEQKIQVGIKTHMPAFFALCSRFAVRTCWQTMRMLFQIFLHFSIHWSCKQGMRLYFCCEVLNVKSQAHDNPRFYWIARQNPGR